MSAGKYSCGCSSQCHMSPRKILMHDLFFRENSFLSFFSFPWYTWRINEWCWVKQTTRSHSMVFSLLKTTLHKWKREDLLRMRPRSFFQRKRKSLAAGFVFPILSFFLLRFSPLQERCWEWNEEEKIEGDSFQGWIMGAFRQEISFDFFLRR